MFQNSVANALGPDMLYMSFDPLCAWTGKLKEIQMKAWVAGLAVLLAVSARADTYNDSTADIDPGIANGGGTLDIVSMEVTHNATNLMFTLTVNGNITTTDWGNFMIGIATGGAGTTTGNGWVRPINLDSPIGGMDFWIGSWVNTGGGT